ncbi:MAG TPA: amino acid ABC transporter [Helicobacteraceae bacterium]|nr:amino acid ABC transporter [Helicobacteraceae bacterium]
MPHISIRINIIINFVILILITTSLLLGLQFYFSLQLAHSAVGKTFNNIAHNVISFTKNAERNAKRTLTLLAMNPEVYDVVHHGYQHGMFEEFRQYFISAPNSQALYIGHPNGDFYKVVNLKVVPELIKSQKAPQKSRWAIITLTKDEGAYIEFLDAENNSLLVKPYNYTLDIQSRPWYKKALTSDTVIRTTPYQYANSTVYGITYATKFKNSKSVIGLDISLANMGQFLKKQNFDTHSYISLYSNSGTKIAVSQPSEPYDWNHLYHFLQNKTSTTTNEYRHNGVRYYTFNSTIQKDATDNLNISILVPKNNLLEPYIEKILYALIAAIVLIILTIPLTFLATNYIVKPIHALMRENEKIKKRAFTSVKPITTFITEFEDLSKSQVSMSNSIQEYQKAQAETLDSIIKLIANAIDAKSAYTGGHCARVPEIAKTLLEHATNAKEGPFKAFHFEGDDNWRAFEIGSWLHDCGKLTTPEFVVDKATKLETIHDRIHEIRTRFEVLWRDAKINYLESKMSGANPDEALKTLQERHTQLQQDFEFIANANVGGEYMSPEKQERIKTIAAQEWLRHFDNRLGLGEEELRRYEAETSELPVKEQLISDRPEHIIKRDAFDYGAYEKQGFKEPVPEHLYNRGELYNLCIAKGTLSPEERYKINEHVIMSIKMLEAIPFPKEYTDVVEYAGTHHETLVGTGYPRQLSADDLSIPARIMAIADIFEALTASDRPYKKAKTLSEAFKIMSFMVKDKHIDADLFELFLRSESYKEYAHIHLRPEQIDTINIEDYLET